MRTQPWRVPCESLLSVRPRGRVPSLVRRCSMLPCLQVARAFSGQASSGEQSPSV